MSNTFLDPVTGLATGRVQLTGRKASVLIANYDQVLSVIAGANSSISITPPVGELWRIKTLYLSINAPTGGTAGIHSLYVAIGALNGGRSWLLAAKSNWSDPIQVAFNKIQTATATNGMIPTTEQTQQKAILDIVVTNASPLFLYYDNGTTAGTQNGTLLITVGREVESIV